ncbi:hypothetical protein [Acetobacter fabarum]|jgi:filamentous hemagglutinin|uniref:hypothetical protein n=1 Tax=Acetobacter fabarum TaxID=483199 RepID=UPI0020A0B969|nr:hypothetical protein [Acetobacter fabarum]MCP1234879.1 hypothetical protein [Acetobacter fabarum]
MNSEPSNPSIPDRVQENGRIIKNKIVYGIDVKVFLEIKNGGRSIVTEFSKNISINIK